MQLCSDNWYINLFVFFWLQMFELEFLHGYLPGEYFHLVKYEETEHCFHRVEDELNESG